MEIKVKIPDEIAAQAKARGISVDAYIRRDPLAESRSAAAASPAAKDTCRDPCLVRFSCAVLGQDSPSAGKYLSGMDLSGT